MRHERRGRPSRSGGAIGGGGGGGAPLTQGTRVGGAVGAVVSTTYNMPIHASSAAGDVLVVTGMNRNLTTAGAITGGVEVALFNNGGVGGYNNYVVAKVLEAADITAGTVAMTALSSNLTVLVGNTFRDVSTPDNWIVLNSGTINSGSTVTMPSINPSDTGSIYYGSITAANDGSNITYAVSPCPVYHAGHRDSASGNDASAGACYALGDGNSVDIVASDVGLNIAGSGITIEIPGL